MKDHKIKPPAKLVAEVRELMQSSVRNSSVVRKSHTPGRRQTTGVAGAARALGCTREIIYKILGNGKMHRSTISMLVKNKTRVSTRDTIRMRVINSVRYDRHLPEDRRSLYRLEKLAKLVEEYGETFYSKSSNRKSNFHMFLPKSAINDITRALRSAESSLRRIHEACPEYDSVIFAEAPKLLGKLTKRAEGHKACMSGESQNLES